MNQERGRHSGSGRLYVLDPLRLIAALCVLVYHLTPWMAIRYEQPFVGFYSRTFWEATRYGWLGVPLFFLISGFVISMSSWGRTLAQFVVSRIARLWPAYVAAIVLTFTALSLWPAPNGIRPPISTALLNVTMAQSLLGVGNIDPVYWSLIVELKFYLLFSIVVWRGVTYRRAVAFCVLWIVAGLFAQESHEALAVAIFEPLHMPYLVGGVVLYLIYRFGPNLILWGLLVTSWILATHSVVTEVNEHAVFGEPTVTAIAILVVTVFYALLTATALGLLGWIRGRWLVTIGALSYPVYLLHNEIGAIAIRELTGHHPPWAMWAFVVVGVLLLSYLVHRLVERPVSKLLRTRLLAGFEEVRGMSRTDVAMPGASQFPAVLRHVLPVAQPEEATPREAVTAASVRDQAE